MANIRIDLNHAPLDGETISFKAPCDASSITGLILYYDNGGTTVSKRYTLTDANGNDIGVLDNIFAKDAIVKAILDTDGNKAFVQNPNTNTYLEEKFDTKADASHKHTKSQITDFPTSMPASDVYAWAKASTKPTYTASEVGAAASSHNHSASNITSGTLPVARGGTGNTSVDTTPTSGSTKMVTSGGVYTALSGKAPAYSYGTEDLTAGTSSLETGKLHFVYE